MNDDHVNPARLRERRNQVDLVERIAGQAARDLPEPPPLSPSALARIAMRIEEHNKPRALRFGRALVAASVLLGIVTVASAARMDLMPRWMAKMVGIERKAVEKTVLRPAKPRATVKRGEAVTISATRGAEPVPPKQEAQAEAVSEPAGSEDGKAEVGRVEPGKKLALAAGGERPGVGGTVEQGRTFVDRGHGQVYGHGHVYGQDHVDRHDQDHGHGNAEGIVGNREPSRLAMKAMAPVVISPITPASEAIAPSTLAPEKQAHALATPVPSERPVPPPVPAPALPAPAPAAPAPTHNPAARQLKEIVHALRVQHAPRTALDLLDRHAGELKGNAFAEEALLLRVEALLALRQQPEALRLLDGLSLANAASSSVLLLTRGQLRASANRCAEAVTDFDLALARTLRPSKQALLGRSQCKQKLGDAKAAQADLDRLRREFPGDSAP